MLSVSSRAGPLLGWRMTVNQALQAIREGRPVHCEELDYRDHLRFALWKVATDCAARGQDELADRLWRAISRLDARFGLEPPGDRRPPGPGGSAPAAGPGA